MSGSKTSWVAVRRGQGDVIVLLHCLGADRHLWDGIIGSLSCRFDTVTCDLPGHGVQICPSESYTIENLTDQLAEMLASARIARAHIAGVSLGGLIAQDFAARYADRTAGLVLIDTIARYPDSMRTMWLQRAKVARAEGMAALIPVTLETWFSPQFLAADNSELRYARAVLGATSPEGYALACEALANADLASRASSIRAPTLLLCGSDEMAVFKDAALWFAQHISGATLQWLTPARHMGVLQQPELIAAHMMSFLCPSKSYGGSQGTEESRFAYSQHKA